MAPALKTKKAKRPRNVPRLPNGFGSIVTLSGNRRKPFMARKTVGFDTNTGYPIYRTIGYFETWMEGYEALVDYNRNPYDLEKASLTFADVYDMWSKKKFSETKNGKKLSKSGVGAYRAAYHHCEALHNLKFVNINLLHLQAVLDNCSHGRATQENIRLLIGQMNEYANLYDITDKDYSKGIVLTKQDTKSKRKNFTADEIALLESHRGELAADYTLIMLYTGMRIDEVRTMKRENVHLDERYMIGGNKTAAGKNRVIPIHFEITDCIQRLLDRDEPVLCGFSQQTIRKQFNALMAVIGVEHLPHDCRHTFISRADELGMPRTVLQAIVGHAGKDIDEQVYIHKNLQNLLDAIDGFCY